jgi:hypothetical protein
MKPVEGRVAGGYPWHVQCTIILACALLTACSVRNSAPDEPPAEAARHRAALALVSVLNETAGPLIIAFRTATAPVQEVVIGRVDAGQRARMAPVPAGEPIVLLARSTDGGEHALAARSFPLDAEWTWDIQPDATFTKPARAN